MSGAFSGPPSLSQERIHGVTANLSRIPTQTLKEIGVLERINAKNFHAHSLCSLAHLKIFSMFMFSWLLVSRLYFKAVIYKV